MDIGKDVRYAIRMLIKDRLFALVSILTLALGIGANTAVFTVVNGVLFRPLPYQDPDRLMILWEKSLQQDTSVSYPNFLDWNQQNRVFENMAAFRLDDFNLTGAGEAERLQGRMMSASLLRILGFSPLIGRDFKADEDRIGGKPVVILSHRLWKNKFGGNAGVIGKQIQLNDQSYTVIGVLPAHYRFFSESDVFLPIGQFSNQWPKRVNHPGIYVLARLKQGMTLAQVRADLNLIAGRLEREFPAEMTGRRIQAENLKQYITAEIRPVLLMLLIAITFVLLISCANVANLLLSRSNIRQKEIAVRIAIGAGRARLIRQLLVESIFLGLIGGTFGLFLAFWGIEVLTAVRPANLPRIEDIALNHTTFLFSALLSITSGVVFGLAPALQISSPNVQEFLKESGSATQSLRKHRFAQTLVVSQFSLALLLLISAGLMIKSIYYLQKVSPGFNSDNLLTIHLSLSPRRYQGQQVVQFFRNVKDQLESIGGVDAVSYTNGLPLAGANEGWFFVEGRPSPDPGREPLAVQYITGSNYHRTMKIPLVRGRYFDSNDGLKSKPVIIIDEELAQRYFEGEDPLGKRLTLGSESPVFEVIGIVGHVKHYSLDAAGPVGSQIYIHIDQVPDPFLAQVAGEMSLVVRTEADPQAVAPVIRKEIARLDANQPVYGIQTMEHLMAESYGQRRFAMQLLTIFATLALILAIAGIYGVVSYSVSQRTREIGIRMAIGAMQSNILSLIVGSGVRMVLVGLLIGVSAAFFLSRLLAAQLYYVSPLDPVTFISTAVLMGTVALAASYIPARRAAKTDPLSALRYE